MIYEHQPVLLEETIEYLNIKKDGIYIDGTLGRGGHTEAILHYLDKEGLMIGIDRDPVAIEAVHKNLISYDNLKLIHSNFTQIPGILDRMNIKEVDGMIFDLGISSPQVDNPERGFSYQQEGPLDMRMNLEQDFSAANIVNDYDRDEIYEIIKNYGEERWASRIANFIIDYRKKKPIRTTSQLVKIIKNAIPASARRGGGHPARRTFQALRITTNNELKQLEEMIKKAVDVLKPGGRIIIISFHSLEDRIVKHTFRYLAKNCICPPDFPICVCDKEQTLNIITRKPVEASKNEIKNNPRARSAKMRVGEKVLNRRAGE